MHPYPFFCIPSPLVLVKQYWLFFIHSNACLAREPVTIIVVQNFLYVVLVCFLFSSLEPVWYLV